MERLISLFDRVDPLSSESKELLRNHLVWKSLKKGELYFEKDRVCSSLAFVVEGIFRVFEVNELGEEKIQYFVSEGHFIVDLESFHNKMPSSQYGEALTDCTVLQIKRSTFDYFTEHIPNWSLIIARLTERALLQKLQISREMIKDDAPTRYAKLMERQPHVVQRVPLGMISSYLGISPFTLSRIRKEYV